MTRYQSEVGESRDSLITGKLLTPQLIRDRATNLYRRYLAAWLTGTDGDWFPRTLPGSLKMKTDSFSEIVKGVESLRRGEKQQGGHGYRLEFKRVRRRDTGENEEVDKVWLDFRDDLLALAGKKFEFASIERVVRKLRAELPELEDWIVQNIALLSKLESRVDGLISVVQYLREHPQPGVFARELPLATETKFVENNRGVLDQWLSTVSGISINHGESKFYAKYGFRDDSQHHTLKILDSTLLDRFGLKFREFSLPRGELVGCDFNDINLLIVENRVNLLTLPSLPSTIGLEGHGKAVTRYQDLSWLRNCRVLYWGDIDVEGFRILASLRSSLNGISIKSLMMDVETLDQFCDPSDHHPPTITSIASGLLTTEERLVFDYCRDHSRWLEQEKIPHRYVVDYLRKHFHV
jgi:hypothetical protein